MIPNKNTPRSPNPSKYASRLFKFLSTGKYAPHDWAIEFMHGYLKVLGEDGPEAANKWAWAEVAAAVGVTSAERMRRIFQIGVTIWRLFT